MRRFVPLLLTRRALVGAAPLALAACTPKKAIEAATKMAKVAVDPDTPVGEPKDQPSTAAFALYAEKDVNKNPFGQPAPVDIWIFQLSDDAKLRTLDFMTLSADPKAALGVSYVAHKETQVEPGKSKIIEPWEIKTDVSAIGVAVGYRNIQTVNWRALDVIKQKGETYKIVVAIRARDVSIQIHR
jgi:type VI secretion system protein VasD